MRVLILGGAGMLGHQLVESFSHHFDVAATYRMSRKEHIAIGAPIAAKAFYSVDAREFSSVEAVVFEHRPDAIVNCVGIVKQRASSYDPVDSIAVNSLFPHQVSNLAASVDARLIHISTDCVFSGSKGMYCESDLPDASDLYGRSKLLGETISGNAVTLRTSIIGLELINKASLVEWFLSQGEKVRGYRRAIYSGLTTLEIGRVIKSVLSQHTSARGLYHVSSDPIDKFSLLSILRSKLNLRIEVEPDELFETDKSLNSERFRTEFGYAPPTWDKMLEELARQVEERKK